MHHVLEPKCKSHFGFHISNSLLTQSQTYNFSCHFISTSTEMDWLDSIPIPHQPPLSPQAAVVPSFPLQFQAEYVALRAALLEAHVQLLRTCNTFRTCPPAAIATALAVSRGKELTKYEHIVTQVGVLALPKFLLIHFYTPTTKCGGGLYWIRFVASVGHSVGPSVCLQFLSAL